MTEKPVDPVPVMPSVEFVDRLPPVQCCDEEGGGWGVGFDGSVLCLRANCFGSREVRFFDWH